MICKFKKQCEMYEDNSETCNHEQQKDDGSPYCGKFRELANKKRRLI